MLPKLSAFIVLLLALAHSTLGSITSIEVPTRVLHPGQDFSVTFITQNDFKPTVQYYVVFGLHHGTTPPPGTSVGEVLLTSSGSDLVASGHSITGDGHFRVRVTLPQDLKAGPKKNKKPWILTAAVFETTGKLNIADVVTFNGEVTIAPF